MQRPQAAALCHALSKHLPSPLLTSLVVCACLGLSVRTKGTRVGFAALSLLHCFCSLHCTGTLLACVRMSLRTAASVILRLPHPLSQARRFRRVGRSVRSWHCRSRSGSLCAASCSSSWSLCSEQIASIAPRSPLPLPLHALSSASTAQMTDASKRHVQLETTMGPITLELSAQQTTATHKRQQGRRGSPAANVEEGAHTRLCATLLLVCASATGSTHPRRAIISVSWPKKAIMMALDSIE